MKIQKHGKEHKDEHLENFKCENCGCEFTAIDDEYYVDKAGAEPSSTITTWISINNVVKDYLICSCPECHKIIKKVYERCNINGLTIADNVTYVHAPVTSCMISGVADDTLEINGSCTSANFANATYTRA